MRYAHLPAVGSLPLPELERHLTAASSSRLGAPILKVWLHRWGGGTFESVEHFFDNPVHEASSHVVYAGELGEARGRCAQMVPWERKAWTEAAFNRTGVSIECADAIWLGGDPRGFARAARITAYLLHANGLPPNWRHGPTLPLRGFLRHADGLRAAGGHTRCPTTDLNLWWQFVGRVKAEHEHDRFRRAWGI